MAVPPVATPLGHLGQRPFSFFPPIVRLEHNEWLLRRAEWAEILVVNTRTDQEVWIPRRYLGSVSSIDEPVLIVGLNRELEYAGGRVIAHERRVLEMPPRTASAARSPEAPAAEISPISLDSPAERRLGRFIGASLVLGVIACTVMISLYRMSRDESRVRYRPVVQAESALAAGDRYEDVERKLGAPAASRWRRGSQERAFRVLEYPDRGWTVVMMGSERGDETYIGTLGREREVVHSVQLPGGASTVDLLRRIEPF